MTDLSTAAAADASRPRALVYGVAITSRAVARALHRRGIEVVIADDSSSTETLAVGQELAAELGCRFMPSPDTAALHDIVRTCTMVCPAPGVPETHAVIVAAQAAGVRIVSELDLAYDWEQARLGGPRPMLGITGTDGKTTVTLMATAMLEAAGRRPAAVGNTEVPLVEALDDPALAGVDVFVVECSSFRLRFVETFRAQAAVWLNLAPDHQNWHVSMDSYAHAKAQIWATQRADDVVVFPPSDPVVARFAGAAPGRAISFGEANPSAGALDYFVRNGSLLGPFGELLPVAEMSRGLPHDCTNALAAAALVVESGLATPAQVATALRDFQHPPHRIEPLGTIDGVAWFNDSKATSPHAALRAIRSFDRIVLLAGGRNKGLDLSELASERARIVSVVALGESADEIVAAFSPHTPVSVATSMADAVEIAARTAVPGDTVLLSPACASFDWYPGGGYPARGDDFRQLVRHRQIETDVREAS